MAEVTKPTRKDMFAEIKTYIPAEAEHLHEMVDKYIEQLSKPRKHKVDPEVAEFREDVLNWAEELDKTFTAKDVAEAFQCSSQKASAALKALVEAGDLETTETEDGNKTKTYVAAQTNAQPQPDTLG